MKYKQTNKQTNHPDKFTENQSSEGKNKNKGDVIAQDRIAKWLIQTGVHGRPY